MDTQPAILAYEERLFDEPKIVKTEVIKLKSKFGFVKRFIVKTTKQIGERLIDDVKSSNGAVIHRGGYLRPILKTSIRYHEVIPKDKYTY